MHVAHISHTMVTQNPPTGSFIHQQQPAMTSDESENPFGWLWRYDPSSKFAYSTFFWFDDGLRPSIGARVCSCCFLQLTGMKGLLVGLVRASKRMNAMCNLTPPWFLGYSSSARSKSASNDQNYVQGTTKSNGGWPLCACLAAHHHFVFWDLELKPKQSLLLEMLRSDMTISWCPWENCERSFYSTAQPTSLSSWSTFSACHMMCSFERMPTVFLLSIKVLQLVIICIYWCKETSHLYMTCHLSWSWFQSSLWEIFIGFSLWIVESLS